MRASGGFGRWLPSTIHGLADKLRLDRGFADDLIKRGVAIDEARRLILDQVAAKADETRIFPHVSIPLGGRDATVTRREAISSALLHRYSPTLFPLEDAAREYRGMTLMELARESLETSGASLLVADERLNKRDLGVASRSNTGRGRSTASIFLLVPQVRLPKRLDLDRDAERALDSVPGLIVADWVEARL